MQKHVKSNTEFFKIVFISSTKLSSTLYLFLTNSLPIYLVLQLLLHLISTLNKIAINHTEGLLWLKTAMQVIYEQSRGLKNGHYDPLCSLFADDISFLLGGVLGLNVRILRAC